MLHRKVPGAILVLGLSVVAASAGDWPQFRGPAGNGTSGESQLPTEWGKDKNVYWKVAIPGLGWSSPIVLGNRVFITTAVTDKQEKPKHFDPKDFAGMKDFKFPKDGKLPKDFKPPKGMFGDQKPPDALYRFQVICLDRDTGKILWNQTALERKPTIAKYHSNSYATETPVTDGERVYAYFGMHGLFCYDLEGKQVWQKDLGAFPMAMGFGTGSSPALVDGRLLVQCDNDEKSFLIAFEAKTGKELWKIDRAGKTSWSTPFVWKARGRTQVVVCGDTKVISYDPENGKVLWELGGITGTFQASPAADDERIYFGNNGPFTDGRLFAVKADATGDITLKEGETSNSGVAWARPRSGPQIASPLVYQGYVYILDRAAVSCHKADTGEPVYTKERLEGARGFSASPWAYDGKVFCLDEDGKTFVFKAGPTFEILAKNPLDEMSWASPAISSGRLFLRGSEHLYCIKP